MRIMLRLCQRADARALPNQSSEPESLGFLSQVCSPVTLENKLPTIAKAFSSSDVPEQCSPKPTPLVKKNMETLSHECTDFIKYVCVSDS